MVRGHVLVIGFVYIWRDRKRGLYYVGSHCGREDDGYVCSAGRRFWAAYNKRPEDFKRRILERIYGDETIKVFDAEHRWLQFIKIEELGVRYYNLKRAAMGLDSDTLRRLYADPILALGKRVSEAVKAAHRADPSIIPRRAASVAAARAADPTICVRIGIGTKAANIVDPTISQRRVASLRVTLRADPTINQRRGASVKAARLADPSILERQSASAVASHIADPTIVIRRGLAIKAAVAADPTINQRRGASVRATMMADPSIAMRRGLLISAIASSKTPEQRSEAIRKGWETRRAKIRGELQFV